jgi:hypothetical protein
MNGPTIHHRKKTMNTETQAQARAEYRVLNRAQKTIRENFMAGDMSGFETHEDLYRALRAMEARMFEITALFA